MTSEERTEYEEIIEENENWSEFDENYDDWSG
jgi:hypothetical protein